MTDATSISDVIERLDALAARLDQPAQRYLTVDGAATYCSVSDDTIRRAISGGHISALRPARGRIVLDRAELDAWLKSTADTKLRRGRGVR